MPGDSIVNLLFLKGSPVCTVEQNFCVLFSGKFNCAMIYILASESPSPKGHGNPNVAQLNLLCHFLLYLFQFSSFSFPTLCF